MNFFDKLTDFVFDERKKISSKAALIVLALLGVLMIDNLLGFSYSYSLENKIDHIQKLNAIISDSTSDKFTRHNAIVLRNEVFKRQNIFESTQDYITDAFKESPAKIKNTDTGKLEIQIKPNNFLFHLSSSLTFYLVAIIMFPLMLFVDKKSSLPQRIAMSLLLTLMFSGIGIVFYWICSLIPMILPNSWVLNYICNILIQGLVIYFIFKFAPK